jgi:outer membrane PBP1 activator LpoA protein
MRSLSSLVSAAPLGSALLALALGGCAGMTGTATAPGLPMSAGYPDEQAVVLLLPTGASGFVQDAAEAIEAGYAAARLRDAKATVSGETIDTSGGAASAFKASAAADPRPLIVGPLLKGDVNSIATLRGETDPAMLALNQAESAQRGLYQFGLAPEDEAKTVAALAKELAESDETLKTAIVYPANDPWGESMRGAFVSGLAPSEPALQASYTDESIAAITDELESAGVGLVFMVARPEDAAGVYAAITAAAGPTVISTSHATDRADARSALKDLFYVDVPWLVDREKATEFQQRAAEKPDSKYTRGQLGRLYAMGVDAYYLGALVANTPPGAPPALTLDAGMTGALSFTTQGRLLKRRLVLGRVGTDGVLALSTAEELSASLARSDIAGASSAEETDEG